MFDMFADMNYWIGFGSAFGVMLVTDLIWEFFVKGKKRR